MVNAGWTVGSVRRRVYCPPQNSPEVRNHRMKKLLGVMITSCAAMVLLMGTTGCPGPKTKDKEKTPAAKEKEKEKKRERHKEKEKKKKKASLSLRARDAQLSWRVKMLFARRY